jgi:single-strand DNA-binding protein
MNFNKAIIIGRLTKDPETRTTPNGQTVASIGVATNRVWNSNSGEKQEKVEFHSIVAWGKLAEICGQYLTKGQLALFEGRLETRTWEGQDGVKRSKTEIVAENMQMGPRPRSQEGGSLSSYHPKEETRQNNNEESLAQKQALKESKPDNNSNEEIKIEDIPF